MKPHAKLLFASALLAVFQGPEMARAEPMRSSVAFNTGIQQMASVQPEDGVALHYPVALAGGKLDGCEASIAETLFPRDKGRWGIFQVDAKIECQRGGFEFVSSGAWDSSGFHGSGHVTEDSGTGDFENLAGRVAQIGGSLSPSTAGTFDIVYELLVDRTGE